MVNKLFYKAFTLAEVLITLLIIGVVASIVVPNLLNDTKDAELNTALKKVYGELSLATKQIIFDNGGTFVDILEYDTDREGLRNAYTPHLNFIKSCTLARTEGCWHPLSVDGGTWKQLNGASTDSSTVGTGLLLNNGALINFVALSKNCSDSSAYYLKPIVCGRIIIDVNGFKAPNITGKDIFYFNILSNKLEPWGVPDSYSQICSPSTGGIYCTASKLMQ